MRRVFKVDKETGEIVEISGDRRYGADSWNGMFGETLATRSPKGGSPNGFPAIHVKGEKTIGRLRP